MSGRFRMLAVSCACAWALLASTAPASPVLLGYEDSYERGDGKRVVHRGVDLAMSSGDGVVAPVSGSVAFAGRVPGSSGGSILCVSLETKFGTVSLLPLSDLSVTRGQSVSIGQQLGVLAGQGDASFEREHLHAGLRVGGEYVDPSVLIAGLLANAAGSSTEAVASGQVPSVAGAAPSVDRALGGGASVGTGGALAGTIPSAVTLPPLERVAAEPPVPQVGSAPDASLAPEPGSVTQPRSATEPGPVMQPGPVTLPAAVTQASTVTRPASVTQPVSATRPVSAAIPDTRVANRRAGNRSAGAPVVQEAFGGEILGHSAAGRQEVASTGATLVSGLARLAGERRDAMSTRYTGPVAAGMAAALAMMSYAGLIMVTRRLMTRHIRRRGSLPLRLGITLQHPRVGGRLRGLTSCSGPTAFTVPGPPAQRR